MSNYVLRKPMPGELKGDLFKFNSLRDWYVNVSYRDRQTKAGKSDTVCVYPRKIVEESPAWFEKIEKNNFTKEEVDQIVREALNFSSDCEAMTGKIEAFDEMLKEKGLF